MRASMATCGMLTGCRMPPLALKQLLLVFDQLFNPYIENVNHRKCEVVIMRMKTMQAAAHPNRGS